MDVDVKKKGVAKNEEIYMSMLSDNVGFVDSANHQITQDMRNW